MTEVGVWIPCYRRWVGRKAVLALATTAEDLGFGSLWVQDHLVAPTGDAESAAVDLLPPWLEPDDYGNEQFSAVEYYGEENWWLDPYALWGFLAACTERVELGSAIVVLPYRSPIIQAKMLGTLDVLSEGRMLFGVGVGHVPSEFEAVGVPYTERGARTDEYLAVIDALLSSPEASFEGQFVEFDNVRTLIQPTRRPPFLIGGTSKRSVRRAVEMGDGWLPAHVAPDKLATGIRYLEETAEERGRPVPEVSVVLVWGLATGDEKPRSSRRRFRTVAETAELIAAYAELGVERLVIDVPNPDLDVTLAQYELLAQAVELAQVGP